MHNDCLSAIRGCCLYNWCAHIFGNSQPPLVTAVNDFFKGLPAEVGENIVSFIEPTGFSKKEIKVFGAFFAGLCLVSKCFRETFLRGCTAKLADIKKTYDIAIKYSGPGFCNMNGRRYEEYAEKFVDPRLRLRPHYLHAALRDYRDGRATEDELKEILRLIPSSVHSRQLDLQSSSPNATVLAAACSFEKVDVKVIKLLFNHGANPNAFHLLDSSQYTRLCCVRDFSGNPIKKKRKEEILSLFTEKKEPKTFLIDKRDVANAITLTPFLQGQRNLRIEGEFNCREYLNYLLPDELEYDLVKDTLLSGVITQEEWEKMSLEERLPRLTLQSYIKNLIVNAGITPEELLKLDGDTQKELIRHSDKAASLLKNMSLEQLLSIERQCLLTALKGEKVIADLYEQGAIKTEELMAQKTPEALKKYLSSQRESAYWIESNILAAERLLSCCAFIPIVPGAIKAIGGTVQAVAGLAFSLFFLLKYSQDKEQKSWQKVVRAASHILHGCANVLNGTLEAIPTLGLGIALKNISVRLGLDPDWRIGQSDKTLGYAKLLPTFRGDTLLTSAEFTV